VRKQGVDLLISKEIFSPTPARPSLCQQKENNINEHRGI